MKKVFDKVRITTCALFIGAMGSFVGAITSSLAWYAYSTTATASYKGTAVSEAEQLQVGLNITDLLAEDPTFSFTAEQIEQYGIITVNDTENSQTYAFMAPGIGLDPEIISRYLEHSGYATNELPPTSSQKYSGTGDLTLKEHLWAFRANNTNDADKSMYSVIPFAFRVVQYDNEANEKYAKNQNIWLTSASAVADGVGNVYKAVRCHFRSELCNFLFNPSGVAVKDAGGAFIPQYTKVGGLLDLNGDGYYDADGTYYSQGTEIMYGGYDGALPTATLSEEDSEIVDINETGNTSMPTTFTAKHQNDKYCYDDISSVNVHKAYYKTLDEIRPATDSTGFLSGGQVLCKTSNDDFAIANLTAKVYLEGWDHNVIDQELSHKFALGLTFEINRVS